MSASLLKSILALAAACIFFGGCTVLVLTRRGVSTALQALGIGCFGVVALTHVFEQFSILPEFGWGQPHSVGHFIDLIAALLAIALVTTSFLPRRGTEDAMGATVAHAEQWAASLRRQFDTRDWRLLR